MLVYLVTIPLLMLAIGSLFMIIRSIVRESRQRRVNRLMNRWVRELETPNDLDVRLPSGLTVREWLIESDERARIRQATRHGQMRHRPIDQDDEQ